MPSRSTEHTIGVDEARDRILAAVDPLPATELCLDDALGLTLAADIVSAWTLPPFDNSAMDGFALRAGDTAGATADTPTTLRVIGTVAAGHAGDTPVGPGEAIRIMTGAPIPTGADAVERVERVTTLDDRIAIASPVKLGDNIRPAGEDVRAGDTILTAGAPITAPAIALLAAIGHGRAPVHRRPRVGVLVTGDEVMPAGTDLRPGQIFNSNGPMLAAMVREAGGEPIDLGTAGDDDATIRERLAATAGLDLMLTTGGVSVGDFDIVKAVLQSAGDVTLWSVRIKPGKPLAFGRLGDSTVIGLPGNPVAAAVAFLQFARPAIRRMLGRHDACLPEVDATVRNRIVNRGRRTLFARARVERSSGGYVATVAGAQGSAILSSLAATNGLVVIPEEIDCLEPGDTATVQLPGWDLSSGEDAGQP
jgi:molybdopterin molybdotransferase